MPEYYRHEPGSDTPPSKFFDERSRLIRFAMNPMWGALSGVVTIYADAPKFHLVYTEGTREEATCPDVQMPEAPTEDNFPWSAIITAVQDQRTEEQADG